MTAKKALTGMMVAAAMLFGGSQSAQAVVENNGNGNGNAGASTSGETKVNVNVPDFIILHYYSNLTMNFAAPTQSLDEGAKSWDNVSWSTGTYDGAIALSQDAKEVNNGEDVKVSLNNVWAVRGFSPSGSAKITIENKTPTITNKETKSSIEMKNLALTSGSVSPKESIEVKLNGISKSRATKGGISMDLDFSKTITSGLHEGGQYKITAITI
ncbi:MAG: hypothetical protein HGA57_01400 [Chlorobium limicola]|jgi:hypothetical protein|uniref:Uncharacterized protein n=1 Tax=Chlorobium limicola (strain DSM 245 / NBRC 103803 / 6330) TaxID=290315 RepID=B3EC70_CHLL2|nr:hypothetical protein [Chlorobium limicola]ACD90145.1 conserved hypothetical protein [Chlorobium limicola DSM 245]NTV20031.1 hypothetical protein [Chlorobium limicola]